MCQHVLGLGDAGAGHTTKPRPWFVDRLGFSLVEDTPLAGGKRWGCVEHRRGGGATLLLARCDSDAQAQVAGNEQAGGRVGFFLYTDDVKPFARYYYGVLLFACRRVLRHGCCVSLYGNPWDLIEMATRVVERRAVTACQATQAGLPLFVVTQMCAGFNARWRRAADSVHVRCRSARQRRAACQAHAVAAASGHAHGQTASAYARPWSRGAVSSTLITVRTSMTPVSIIQLVHTVRSRSANEQASRRRAIV